MTTAFVKGFDFTWPARVVEVHDGDTPFVDLDRGYRDRREREAIRLDRLWCAELDQAGGPEAQAYAATLLPVDAIVLVRTKTLLSLGRTLGSILYGPHLDLDFSTEMIRAGYGWRTKAEQVAALGSAPTLVGT